MLFFCSILRLYFVCNLFFFLSVFFFLSFPSGHRKNKKKKKMTTELLFSKSFKEKPHECPHCDYKTLQKGHLTRHIRIHTNEKPDKCPSCDYKSGNPSNLARHPRTHPEKRNHTSQERRAIQQDIFEYSRKQKKKTSFQHLSFISFLNQIHFKKIAYFFLYLFFSLSR